jgi:hypothetical protein
MAWEWVSPVAAASGGLLGGGIGAFFTWLTGKQSREHAEWTLEQQLGATRLLAREERQQERLRDAYLELLKMAERVGHWAQFVNPEMDTNPSSMPDVRLPPLEMQADAAALVEAFGSNQVRDRSEAWQEVVRGMITLAVQINQQEAHPSHEIPAGESPRTALYRRRTEEERTRHELYAEVRAELRSLYGSSARGSGVTGSYTNESGQLTMHEAGAAREGAPPPQSDPRSAPTPETPEQPAPPPSQ